MADLVTDHQTRSQNREFFESCRRGKIDDIERLLHACVDVNVRDLGGVTGLLHAVMNREYKTSQLLIEKYGADASIGTYSGITPLHEASRLHLVDCLRLLLDTGHAPIHAQTREGYTCLHVAAVNNQLPIAKILVEEYGADVTIRDKANKKPVECCIYHEFREYLKKIEIDIEEAPMVKFAGKC